MDRRIVNRSCCLCVALVVLLASLLQAAAVGSFISGSYHVIQKRDLGAQMQVVLQVRLVNHGPEALLLQKLALQNASQAQQHWANITVGPRGTQQTTQQFTIPRQEYENWRRGLGPVLRLEGRSANGRIVQTIRLDSFGAGVK